MGLFDSLEKLGIKNVSGGDLYKKEEKEAPVKQQEAVAVKEIPDEKEFLLKKTYECPVCGTSYKDITLKTGKARLTETMKNLRPKFEWIEPLKYETLVCPRCGYAVMSRYLTSLAPSQKKALKEQIAMNFVGRYKEKEVYTYDEAIERITLALAAAVVKRGKASEKAYICLKGGWLCEAYLDVLNEDPMSDEAQKESIKEKAKEFLDNAYEGFVNAMQEESFPIAGMDEVTLDYLIAEMAFQRKEFDVSAKRVAAILQSRTAPARIKDKALELKNELQAAIRAGKAGA